MRSVWPTAISTRPLLRPADPIKCHVSTERMQTPNRVHTTDNRATVLDSLENNIGHSLPKGRAASTAGIAPDADSRARRVREATIVTTEPLLDSAIPIR